MSDATMFLFVYGTLKRGYTNNLRIANARFEGPAISIDNDYLMQDMGFPVLWHKDGKDLDDDPHVEGAQVSGEIYCINSRQLARCDQLEGNGHMYTRRLRHFKIEKRSVVVAWVYLWNLDRDHDWIKPVDGVLVWDREGRRLMRKLAEG